MSSQNKSSFQNFYDKVQVWHLVTAIGLGLFLFLAVVVLISASKKPDIEAYQMKVILQVIDDYEKLRRSAIKQEGDLLPDRFWTAVKEFHTDTSYKNWDRAKAPSRLNEILENFDCAEKNADELKILIERTKEDITNMKGISDELTDKTLVKFNDMLKCIDKADKLVISN